MCDGANPKLGEAPTFGTDYGAAFQWAVTEVDRVIEERDLGSGTQSL